MSLTENVMLQYTGGHNSIVNEELKSNVKAEYRIILRINPAVTSSGIVTGQFELEYCLSFL
jgi:hypothetical protein